MNESPADTRPLFLCIGAQKAGTSWLHNNLRRHPDIVMPPFKELHFFDDIEHRRGRIFNRWRSTRGLDRRSRNRVKRALANHLRLRPSPADRWTLRFHMITRDEAGIRAYVRLLTSALPPGSIAGDITPAYSTLGKPVIGMIARALPHAKILFLVRDPVEREWSAAKMSLLRFKGKDESQFDETEFERFLAKNHERTDYLRTLENWTSAFDPAQFGMFFYDELREAPLDFLNRILDFLGVARLASLPHSERTNKGVQLEMPPHLRAALFAKHEQQIRRLAEHLDAGQRRYPLAWLERYGGTPA